MNTQLTATVAHPSTTMQPRTHLRWLAVLLTGGALFAALLWSLLETRNPVYVPALLLLGAAVVPVTFTIFVNDIRLPHQLSAARVTAAAVLGGVVGAVVAGQLELETVRQLGFLPTAWIGLIEESAKLAVPAALLLLWRRSRAADGLLLGVAVGSGFAALETMGYGFVALLQAHGDLAPVAQLFMLRAVAEPGGHAAWTGLAGAALFAVRGARRPGWAWLRFLLVFAGVVALHASWDSTAGSHSHGYLIVGVVSLALLLATTWRLRRPAADVRGGPRRSSSLPATDWRQPQGVMDTGINKDADRIPARNR